MKPMTMIFAIYLYFTNGALAQDFRCRPDSGTMVLGGQQHLHVQAVDTLMADTLLRWIDTLSGFEVLDRGEWNKSQNAYIRHIRFAAFDTGGFALPAIPGSAAESLYVHFPLGDPGELRTIKDIETTPAGLQGLLLRIAALLFVVLLLVVLWQFFRADQLRVYGYEPPKLQDAATRALDALEKLRAAQLWQRGQVGPFYDALSSIARNFLEEGLFLPARASTTAETAKLMSDHHPALEHSEDLLLFLRRCDAVKFAQRIPEIGAHDTFMSLVERFIRTHRPLSERLLAQNLPRYHTLLEAAVANQFADPNAAIPEKLVAALPDSSGLEEIVLHRGLLSSHHYLLPTSWVQLHHLHTGSFHRWQAGILGSGRSRFWKLALPLLAAPFLAIFLPLIAVAGLLRGERLFARGIFGVDANGRIALRKISGRWR
ncbi:MAG: hypothetical protein JPMHGGIA_00638 [Saprospiraceae bacterium]|nr:hypothetical protein [Saprospiraceae bacterium]